MSNVRRELTKADIILLVCEFSDSAKCPMSDILVGAGSAMVLLGLRETTNDVDMSVPVDIFEDYLTGPSHLPALYLTNGIDLHKHVGFKSQLKADQGFFIQHPKDILDFKLKLNREKDQADIRALREVASIWGY